MKIAHVIQRYLPAQLTGSENYIRYISEELARKGHEVSVLTSNALDGMAMRDPVHGKFIQKKDQEINGVRVLRFRVNHLFTAYPLGGVLRNNIYRNGQGASKNDTNLIFPPFYNIIGGIWDLITTLYVGPFTPMMYHHIRRSSYQLVHVTPFPLTHVWLAAEAARKSSIPLICTPFMKIDPSFWLLFNRYFKGILAQARAIFACTPTEKRMITCLGFDPKKIHVIPMGVNLDEWSNADGNSFRKELELEDKFLVLFAGQKIYEKGAIHLIRAIDLLRKDVDQIRLVAMGCNSPEWESEKKKIKNVKVIDLPYISGRKKMDIFDACDVFVMPSRIDSFGMVYLEAWACKKPVIGARVDFISDIIKDGVNGYLVEFGNIEEIARKIRYLLESKTLRKELGEKGRENILNNYAWLKIVKKIEDVYNTVVK